MSMNINWLVDHGFFWDAENKFFFKVTFGHITLRATHNNDINKWIVDAIYSFEDKTYKFSMAMENITDDQFKMFVFDYNKQVKETCPNNYFTYRLDFANYIIS